MVSWALLEPLASVGPGAHHVESLFMDCPARKYSTLASFKPERIVSQTEKVMGLRAVGRVSKFLCSCGVGKEKPDSSSLSNVSITRKSIRLKKNPPQKSARKFRVITFYDILGAWAAPRKIYFRCFSWHLGEPGPALRKIYFRRHLGRPLPPRGRFIFGALLVPSWWAWSQHPWGMGFQEVWATPVSGYRGF